MSQIKTVSTRAFITNLTRLSYRALWVSTRSLIKSSCLSVMRASPMRSGSSASSIHIYPSFIRETSWLWYVIDFPYLWMQLTPQVNTCLRRSEFPTDSRADRNGSYGLRHHVLPICSSKFRRLEPASISKCAVQPALSLCSQHVLRPIMQSYTSRCAGDGIDMRSSSQFSKARRQLDAVDDGFDLGD